ncbi:MAG: hypothetical protein AAGA08_04490 [Pseudomonadota bacterium]
MDDPSKDSFVPQTAAERGLGTSLTAATVKQIPGVQDGEEGALYAGDAIACPDEYVHQPDQSSQAIFFATDGAVLRPIPRIKPKILGYSCQRGRAMREGILMTGTMQNGEPGTAAYARLAAPGFVTFTDVTPPGSDELEFVITNEATGKYFLANRATVQFFSIVKETGSVPVALAKAGIPAQQGENLVKRLVQSGLLVRSGETQSEAEKKKTPIESKLVSMRWDLIDAGRATDALGWLGRLLFSPLGCLAWFATMLIMVQQLFANSEKLSLGLRQIFDADWRQFLIFAGLYVAIKIVHEMGHALAYRTMCLQEGHAPGPIRMGISIFAFTPFPFTDVTGAWRLRSVFRRVMIGAGGIYFETWVIAILAIFWAQTQAGMFQTIILQVAVFAGAIALLFNLNPAIKLDGYYMLTDYLRRPNLSGRASQAARAFLAQLLGAKTQPIIGSDLAYWILSYSYRWTIFAGIFWLIYQFDKRLSPIAVAVILMTLVARPLYNSLKLAIKQGIRPFRSLAVLGTTAAVIAALFIPFPDRLLLPGQLRMYETRFVEVSEAGRMTITGPSAFTLENPELIQQIADVGLRKQMLENLNRTAQSSAAEKAGIRTEIDRFDKTGKELEARLAAVSFESSESTIWTPLAANTYDGAWVSPGLVEELGAYSDPVEPYLRLRLDQGQLERDLRLSSDTSLRVRAVHDPACEFEARLTDNFVNSLAIDGQLSLRAQFTDARPDCTESLAHGGAVVARLDTQPRSLFARAKFAGSRLLQNRLDIYQQ